MVSRMSCKQRRRASATCSMVPRLGTSAARCSKPRVAHPEHRRRSCRDRLLGNDAAHPPHRASRAPRSDGSRVRSPCGVVAATRGVVHDHRGDRGVRQSWLSRARAASGIPVMPTRSAPSRSRRLISAAVSRRGPLCRGINAARSATCFAASGLAAARMRFRSAAVEYGSREIDVRHQARRDPSKNVRVAAPGVVDDLVRQPQAPRDRIGCRMPPTEATEMISGYRLDRPSAPRCWRDS